MEPTDSPASDRSLRVAFWNTWLLSPRLWPGGPTVPRADNVFAPDVARRAPLVGAAIAREFDVCALGEAFEDTELDAILAANPHRKLLQGPRRAFPRFTSSGLATLVDERRAAITASNTHAYRAGGDLRDSDTFAAKGALHVRLEVDPNLPGIDLVSTHLFAGGGFFSGFGATDVRRHHAVRVAQLRELVEFVTSVRSPDAALLLVGDFNVCAHDPDPSLAKPTERYDEFQQILAPLNVVDVWAEDGVGLGHTCTFERAEDLPSDPANSDRVIDVDADLDPLDVAGERIDYLWFAPSESNPTAFTVGRPRRWSFGGRDARGGPAGSLSDHLALSVSLSW